MRRHTEGWGVNGQGKNSKMGRGSTWQRALDGEANGKNSHERLIRHRIENSPDDGPQVPAPRDVPVDEVRDAGVDEEPRGPGVAVVHDEVADDRRGQEPREGEDVRQRVDVLALPPPRKRRRRRRRRGRSPWTQAREPRGGARRWWWWWWWPKQQRGRAAAGAARAAREQARGGGRHRAAQRSAWPGGAACSAPADKLARSLARSTAEKRAACLHGIVRDVPGSDRERGYVTISLSRP